MLNPEHTKLSKKSTPSQPTPITSRPQANSTISNAITTSLSNDKPNGHKEDVWHFFTNGMMFICNKDTVEECFKLKLLGLPKYYLEEVQSLEPNKSALFLFNSSSRMLHGILKAASFGGENLVPSAWNEDYISPRYSRYPAQVKFVTHHEYPPIHENSFKHMFPEGRKVHKLSKEQVLELIDIFITKAKPLIGKKPSKVIQPKLKPKPKKVKYFPPAPKENPWAALAKKKHDPSSAPAGSGPPGEYKSASQPKGLTAIVAGDMVPIAHSNVANHVVSADQQTVIDDEVKSGTSSVGTSVSAGSSVAPSVESASSDNGVEIDADGFQKVTKGKNSKHKKKRSGGKKNQDSVVKVNKPEETVVMNGNVGLHVQEKIPNDITISTGKSRKKKKKKEQKNSEQVKNHVAAASGREPTPPIEDKVPSRDFVRRASPNGDSSVPVAAHVPTRRVQQDQVLPKNQAHLTGKFVQPIGEQRFDTPVNQMPPYRQFGLPSELNNRGLSDLPSLDQVGHPGPAGAVPACGVAGPETSPKSDISARMSPRCDGIAPQRGAGIGASGMADNTWKIWQSNSMYGGIPPVNGSDVHHRVGGSGEYSLSSIDTPQAYESVPRLPSPGGNTPIPQSISRTPYERRQPPPGYQKPPRTFDTLYAGEPTDSAIPSRPFLHDNYAHFGNNGFTNGKYHDPWGAPSDFDKQHLHGVSKNNMNPEGSTPPPYEAYGGFYNDRAHPRGVLRHSFEEETPDLRKQTDIFGNNGYHAQTRASFVDDKNFSYSKKHWNGITSTHDGLTGFETERPDVSDRVLKSSGFVNFERAGSNPARSSTAGPWTQDWNVVDNTDILQDPIVATRGGRGREDATGFQVDVFNQERK